MTWLTGGFEASDGERSQVGTYSPARTRASSTVTELRPSIPFSSQNGGASGQRRGSVGQSAHPCPRQGSKGGGGPVAQRTHRLCSHGTLLLKAGLGWTAFSPQLLNRDQTVTLLQIKWKCEDSLNTLLSTRPPTQQAAARRSPLVPHVMATLGAQSRRWWSGGGRLDGTSCPVLFNPIFWRYFWIRQRIQHSLPGTCWVGLSFKGGGFFPNRSSE